MALDRPVELKQPAVSYTKSLVKSPSFVMIGEQSFVPTDKRIEAGQSSNVRVFECKDTHEKVIVKSWLKKLDKKARDKITNECRFFNILHPETNVKAVFFYKGQREVLPFIPGKELRTILTTGNEEEKLRAQIAAAKALKSIHEKGITHGDAHHRNILIELKDIPENDVAHFIDLTESNAHDHSSTEQCQKIFEVAKNKDRFFFYNDGIKPTPPLETFITEKLETLKILYRAVAAE